MRILVVNGPNLNTLGQREPHIYGHTTLAEIEAALRAKAEGLGAEVVCFQSNHEGEIVDAIQEGLKKIDFIILNPGGLTHTSVCIRDALLSTKIPFIEAHLSNIFKREEFRRKSLISDIAVGTITGFGSKSYILAFSAAIDYLKSK